MSTNHNLNKEEKAEVVLSHLKSLSTQKYKLETSLLEENSLLQPSQDIIDQINNNIGNVNLKITALENKLMEVLGD